MRRETLLTASPEVAAGVLRSGGLVAFPTETVYGVGADAMDASAVSRIFSAKGRPADNPLIVHIHSVDQLSRLTASVPDTALRLIDVFFPGPLTIILPKAAAVPDAVSAGLDSIAVRMPSLAIARRFLAASDRPVAAPSANLSGRPSPTRWRSVLEDLGGRIDCILQGDAAEIGLESTVIDCTARIPAILRPGAISREKLGAVVELAAGASEERVVRSPGMKHQHYTPAARVILVTTADEARPGPNTAFIGLATPGGIARVAQCASIEEYARKLYEFFRECDRQGIETIYCEMVDRVGLGEALMDRLERAAAR